MNPPNPKTIQKIINAAQKLFLSNDYYEVSLSMIAKEAGVSKGAIFHYFSSKEELAFAVMDNIMKQFEQQFLSPELAGNEDEILKNFIQTSLGISLQEFGVSRFLLQISGILKDEKSKEMFVKYIEPYLQVIASLLEKKGYKNPYLRARILFAALDGVGVYAFIERKKIEEKEIQAYVEEFLNLFLE